MSGLEYEPDIDTGPTQPPTLNNPHLLPVHGRSAAATRETATTAANDEVVVVLCDRSHG